MPVPRPTRPGRRPRASPSTGSGLPAVFVPAWSAEEPAFDPEFAPTMSAMPVPDVEPDLAPDVEPESEPGAGRIWAFAGIGVLLALVVVLAVVWAGSGDDGSSAVQTPSPTAAPTAAPSAAAPATVTGVGGRPRPATIRGADPTGENCEGGFQITGQAGWASQGVRASPEATCSFVGSVLKAYWDAADPSREPRTVVAAGAIPCGEGAACAGTDFVVTCEAEGADPWITCRGGRNAVVVLY